MLPKFDSFNSTNVQSSRHNWPSASIDNIEPWATDHDIPQSSSTHYKTQESSSPTMLKFLATIRPRNTVRCNLTSQILQNSSIDKKIEDIASRDDEFFVKNTVQEQPKVKDPAFDADLQNLHKALKAKKRKLKNVSIQVTGHYISLGNIERSAQYHMSTNRQQESHAFKLQKLLKLKQKVRRKNMSLAANIHGIKGTLQEKTENKKLSQVDLAVFAQEQVSRPQIKKRPKNTYMTITELLRQKLKQRELKQQRDEFVAKPDELRNILKTYEEIKRPKGKNLPRLKLNETFSGRICHPRQ